jgi:hypothetical protein
MEKALDCRTTQKHARRVAEPGHLFVEGGNIHLVIGISFIGLQEKDKLIPHFWAPGWRLGDGSPLGAGWMRQSASFTRTGPI